MLLTHRKLLQSKAIAIENDLRATLRNFGLKVGMVGTVKFEGRIKELVADIPDLAGMVEPLLIVRRVLREQLGILHRRLLIIVQDDEVCRRLMTIPGVGPVVALTYRVTVDVPARFRETGYGTRRSRHARRLAFAPRVLSLYPSKADIEATQTDVCFVPIANMGHATVLPEDSHRQDRGANANGLRLLQWS